MQPWFMKLNPKGRVPVMLCPDGGVVADSHEIILHLEQFSDNTKPTLLPAKMRDQVLDYHKRFCDVDYDVLTFGTVLFPEVAETVTPFVLSLRQISSNEYMTETRKILMAYRDQAPRELYEAYNEKICNLEHIVQKLTKVRCYMF